MNISPEVTPDAFPGTASDVTDEFVIEKCDYFTTVQLWPLRKEINPRIWLENFNDYERIYARYLLNSFLYLSNDITEQIVVDNFEALSRLVALPVGGTPGGRTKWMKFAADLIVVVVKGEEAHPTDSGYLFSRIVRDRLDISEGRILDVPDVLKALNDGLDVPLVFVDDFVGSGDQFSETWTQAWPIGNSSFSLAQLCARKKGPFIYCPVLATETGIAAIKAAHPEITIQPGHELPATYNAFHPQSLVWPEELRPTATKVIQEASARAGIPDTNGGSDDWRGYHKLGLTVAFSHGVPDATLPLFWWESETWNPLKKRHREP